MKQALFTTVFLFLLAQVSSVMGQTTLPTAEGGCNSAKVTGGIPPPSSSTPLWTGSFGSSNQCKKIFLWSNSTCGTGSNETRFTLQIWLPAPFNGWGTVGTAQSCPEFKNITTHGTYRIAITPVIEELNPNCEGGHILVYNSAGQWIGYKGTFANAPSVFTNSFIVGATTQSEIGYTFVDDPETGAEMTYDYGEIVKMNTAASINYDLWWLAIFENGPTYNRYMSKGWTSGSTVPNNEINLTTFWDNGWGWKFEQFHTYTVQFVTENRKCRNAIEQIPPYTWNALERTFFICPAGTGCRIGEDAKEIQISPNPANSFVRLLNFEPDAGREYRMTIADLAGRVIRADQLTSNEVDISGLQTGMYVLTIERDGKRMYSDKLIVNQ